MTSQVNGLVVSVHFKEGQLVSKGDALIDIDSRTYRATLCRRKACLSAIRIFWLRQRWALNATRQRGRAMPLQSKFWMIRKSCVLQDEGTVKNDQGAVQFDQVQVEYCPLLPRSRDAWVCD